MREVSKWAQFWGCPVDHALMKTEWAKSLNKTFAPPVDEGKNSLCLTDIVFSLKWNKILIIGNWSRFSYHWRGVYVNRDSINQYSSFIWLISLFTTWKISERKYFRGLIGGAGVGYITLFGQTLAFVIYFCHVGHALSFKTISSNSQHRDRWISYFIVKDRNKLPFLYILTVIIWRENKGNNILDENWFQK